MSIEVNCPNGHVLKVKDKYAGQTGLCPKCQARVYVPVPVALTEDAIADMIGPPDIRDLPVHEEVARVNDLAGGSGSSLIQSGMAARETKLCPKCKREVRACYDHCPHCHTYFSDLAEISRRISQQRR